MNNYVLRTRLAFGLVGSLGTLVACAAPALAQWESQGYWQCYQSSWSAYTETRKMEGQTAFECGGGCGDQSHNQPYSWVDITGGISQSQEDTSDSFFGPVSGEWNGCALNGTSQVSTGARGIAGINQGWDRWPSNFGGQYWTPDISFISGSSRPMNYPYASIYDLDCAPGWLSWTWGGSCPKHIVGTVYWPNFPVTATLISGSPVMDENGYGYGQAQWSLAGDTGLACSTPANYCESVVCADLHVRATLTCNWMIYDPCQNLHPLMEIPSECIR